MAGGEVHRQDPEEDQDALSLSALQEELHHEERGDGPLQVRLRQAAALRVPLLRQAEQEEVQHPGPHQAQAPLQASHLQHALLGAQKRAVFRDFRPCRMRRECARSPFVSKSEAELPRGSRWTFLRFDQDRMMWGSSGLIEA
ncbi:hypothetical protein KM043_007657 [Ampulex compressa]|nr:hypothetical protein KM043_007657 [Ampulex compressa]